MPKVAYIGVIIVFLALNKPAYAASVVINEFLAHPSSGNKEWVEFYNPDHLDLSGFYLDDDVDFSSDSGSSAKKSLSAQNTSTPTYPYLEFDSFLNNSGDYVVLFASDGSIVDQYQYQEDPGTDFAIGRSPNGSGSFSKLTTATKGSANSEPQAEPSPSPTPTTFPSPTPNPTPTPTKSPSLSLTPKSSSAPSQSLPKSSPQVLGELSKTITTPQPSPAPSPSNEKKQPLPSRINIATLLVGSGTILLGLSAAFYFWWRRTLETPPEDKEQKN